MSAGMLETNYSEPWRDEEGQSIREGRWSASQQRLVIIFFFKFIYLSFMLWRRGRGGTDGRTDRREDGKRQVLASRGHGAGGS